MTYYERNLPHWHPQGRAIFLTWRLNGSLSRPFLLRWRRQSAKVPGRKFRNMDKELDAAATGPHWLHDERIAQAVVEELGNIRGRHDRCLLHAFAVMPNHVHALVTPFASLSAITNQWKGVTARRANQMLNRVGRPFWQNESFDHWARGPAQFERIRAYIERNPVLAGLVAKPEDWSWSSANERWRCLITNHTG